MRGRGPEHKAYLRQLDGKRSLDFEPVRYRQAELLPPSDQGNRFRTMCLEMRERDCVRHSAPAVLTLKLISAVEHQSISEVMAVFTHMGTTMNLCKATMLRHFAQKLVMLK
ncbi:hypothetical protein I7I51_06244 [Histoplasma capsulatum]|uniref:Uncharacterized protein n=1 Tax=Ajellomyces capsulatus TaxID=5037 RepID=A0A8A1MHC1_AJECA|nr:hypothetical protein I7I51_06244 [Histoplasma capsulatum]